MKPPQIRRALWLAPISALLCSPATAQTPPVQLSYVAYVGALHVANVNATIAIAPVTYRIGLSYRLTGMVGAMMSGEGTSIVDGRFQSGVAEPRELVSNGLFRGTPHVLRIAWRAGIPTITQAEPPDKEEREPVPAAEQANTIDSQSAMAALLRRVASTGRCDSAQRTFDGRRLADLQAHTAGEETLPQTDRSSFQGLALRCDFEGHQIAGFARDGDQAELRKPHYGSAWFARLAPGGPPMPVRITIGAGTFRETTLYLTASSGG